MMMGIFQVLENFISPMFINLIMRKLTLVSLASMLGFAQSQQDLQACGDAFFSPSKVRVNH
jgi:hypothetical protein